MTANEVATYLLKSCSTLKEFASYMFGSSLNGVGSDFDVLIIGLSEEPLSRLKAELKLAGKELPLHVLYMLPEEVTETDFIKNSGCISLMELANQQ